MSMLRPNFKRTLMNAFTMAVTLAYAVNPFKKIASYEVPEGRGGTGGGNRKNSRSDKYRAKRNIRNRMARESRRINRRK